MDLKGMTFAETLEWLESIGEKPYRARQIRSWILTRGVSGFSEMTDISKTFREYLEKNATFTRIEEVSRQTSSDGTIKFLFRLADGHTVESVWIPDEDRATLCVSTQVGCKINCGFCLTGKGGFKRNLDTAEIVDQLVQARRLVPEGKVTNVVLMGMGEPLDNYDNVLQALKVWTDEDGGLIGARKITLSTSGLAPAIERLGDDFPKVKLAVSLNATNDEVRDKIMPLNKKYPLKKLFAALSKWPLPKGRRVTFEYVMLAGVNDSDQDAAELARLCKIVPSKINLIPFNPCPGVSYKRPSHDRVEKFRELLIKKHITVMVRESRGGDILAACGQLREAKEAKGSEG